MEADGAGGQHAEAGGRRVVDQQIGRVDTGEQHRLRKMDVDGSGEVEQGSGIVEAAGGDGQRIGHVRQIALCTQQVVAGSDTAHPDREHSVLGHRDAGRQGAAGQNGGAGSVKDLQDRLQVLLGLAGTGMQQVQGDLQVRAGQGLHLVPVGRHGGPGHGLFEQLVGHAGGPVAAIGVIRGQRDAAPAQHLPDHDPRISADGAQRRGAGIDAGGAKHQVVVVVAAREIRDPLRDRVAAVGDDDGCIAVRVTGVVVLVDRDDGVQVGVRAAVLQTQVILHPAGRDQAIACLHPGTQGRGHVVQVIRVHISAQHDGIEAGQLLEGVDLVVTHIGDAEIEVGVISQLIDDPSAVEHRDPDGAARTTRQRIEHDRCQGEVLRALRGGTELRLPDGHQVVVAQGIAQHADGIDAARGRPEVLDGLRHRTTRRLPDRHQVHVGVIQGQFHGAVVGGGLQAEREADQLAFFQCQPVPVLLVGRCFREHLDVADAVHAVACAGVEPQIPRSGRAQWQIRVHGAAGGPEAEGIHAAGDVTVAGKDVYQARPVQAIQRVIDGVVVVVVEREQQAADMDDGPQIQPEHHAGQRAGCRGQLAGAHVDRRGFLVEPPHAAGALETAALAGDPAVGQQVQRVEEVAVLYTGGEAVDRCQQDLLLVRGDPDVVEAAVGVLVIVEAAARIVVLEADQGVRAQREPEGRCHAHQVDLRMQGATVVDGAELLQHDPVLAIDTEGHTIEVGGILELGFCSRVAARVITGMVELQDGDGQAAQVDTPGGSAQRGVVRVTVLRIGAALAVVDLDHVVHVGLVRGDFQERVAALAVLDAVDRRIGIAGAQRPGAIEQVHAECAAVFEILLRDHAVAQRGGHAAHHGGPGGRAVEQCGEHAVQILCGCCVGAVRIFERRVQEQLDGVNAGPREAFHLDAVGARGGRSADLQHQAVTRVGGFEGTQCIAIGIERLQARLQRCRCAQAQAEGLGTFERDAHGVAVAFEFERALHSTCMDEAACGGDRRQWRVEVVEVEGADHAVGIQGRVAGRDGCQPADLGRADGRGCQLHLDRQSGAVLRGLHGAGQQVSRQQQARLQAFEQDLAPLRRVYPARAPPGPVVLVAAVQQFVQQGVLACRFEGLLDQCEHGRGLGCRWGRGAIQGMREKARGECRRTAAINLPPWAGMPYLFVGAITPSPLWQPGCLPWTGDPWFSGPASRRVWLYRLMDVGTVTCCGHMGG